MVRLALAVRARRGRDALERSGFKDIAFIDRTAAFGQMASAALSRVETELHQELSAYLGEQSFEDFHYWTRLRAAVFNDGGMLQQHFNAAR